MMGDGQSDKISRLTSVDPVQSIQPGKNQASSRSSQSFASYMKEGTSETLGSKGEASSPFELAAQGKSLGITGPTQTSVLGQMASTSSILGDLQNQMSQKNLKLRQSDKYRLRNTLKNTNKNIRAVAKKMGVDTELSPSSLDRKNPFHKFLELLSDSQTQLSNAQSKIQELNAGGVSMNPGDLLLIQVKLTRAQQELEYSSILMSTAVSDIKTLFNIQV